MTDTDALDRAIRRAALDRATWETFASDAKRSLLVEAFLLACDDRTLLAGECERLRAVVDAAMAAGPWPMTVQSGPWFDCRHCGRSGFGDEHESYYRAIDHAPDCPGIALRDALAALTRGEGDGPDS